MDESDILSEIAKFVDSKGRGVLPFGDDVVAIPLGDEYLLINIDGWVESTDRPHGVGLHGVGYRACCNAISDIIAKGAKPQDLVVSISIPSSRSDEIIEITRGIRDAAEKYDINYLGGDINQANDLVIDICVLGKTNQIIRRGGANPGDHVYWLGPNFGLTSVAINILEINWKGDKTKAVNIMSYPTLFPTFIDTCEEYSISSSIDCSDGLAISLYQIMDKSGVGINIDDIVADDWVEEVCGQNGGEVINAIFYGGEELGIVFTSPQLIDDIRKIGEVVKGNTLKYNDRVIPRGGWQHFQIEK